MARVVSARTVVPAPVGGPRAACRQLAASHRSDGERARWLRSAWFASLAQLAPASKRSFCSAWRAWLEFAERFGGDAACQLPPRLGFLLAWAHCFDNSRTYGNYLAHLRRACLLSVRSVEVFQHPAVREARAGIERRRTRPRRKPRFIQRDMLRAIAAACEAGRVARRDFMLMLFSYVFLLRVPSEAVPATFAGPRPDAGSPQSVAFDGTRVFLRLARRKNLRQGGPVMSRGCWCSACPATCPAHVLGAFLQALPPGSRLFPGLRPGSAIGVFRECLRACGVADADAFGTHDARRGHALDMLCNGGSLNEVLAAGQWRSAASLLGSYLPFDRIESAAVLEAAVAESGSEDEQGAAAAREPREARRGRSRTPADVVARAGAPRPRSRASAAAAGALVRAAPIV